MALEEMVLYSLFELPAIFIARSLQRFGGIEAKAAKVLANFIFFAVILAACFAAWFVYLYS